MAKIVFNNPHGRPVEVDEADTTVVADGPSGRVVAAKDPTTGATMMRNLSTETYLPSDMPSEEEEQMMYDDAMNSIEDIEPNPPRRPLFNWKNLRLQQAISGEAAAGARRAGRAGERTFGAAIRLMSERLPANQSIRDSPQIMMLATVEDWVTYVERMADSPIDMGAEFSASVSPSQRIAVTKFVAEWEQDVGHRNLLQKALPGTQPSDLVARGELVYSLMTNRGPNPMRARGYGSFKFDKMFRLAYDIISTMPINFYNSYTLFNLPALEGEAAFREAVDRYVPLDLSEVGMAIQMQQKLAEYGPGYAQIAVADPSMSNETYRLMQQVVNGYNIGDTAVVRSALNALQDAPFYYMAEASADKSVFDAQNTADKGVTGVAQIPKKVFGDDDSLYYNGLIFLKDFPQAAISDKTKGAIDFKSDKVKNQSFEVVKSPFDTTVVGVLKFGAKKDNISFVKGATKSKTMNRKEKIDAATEMAEALGNPGVQSKVESILVKEGGAAGLKPLMKAFPKGTSQAAAKKAIAKIPSVYQHKAGDYILKNPRGKPVGRGKFYTLELHPKTQLDMKLAVTTSSGQGDARHGRGPRGKEGSQNTWTKGLYKVLDADIEKRNAKHRKDKKTRKDKFPKMGLMVTGGKHKKTGSFAPYRIKLPKSHFAIGRTPDGAQSIGLQSGKASPAIKAAWEKFTDEYGVFVRKDTKSTQFRFIPSKKAEHRGAYYDKLRRQVGAKKSR